MMKESKIKYRKAAELMKAFAHPTRIMIIDKLQRGEMCVGNMEKQLGLKQANVSQHLNILRSCGIVDYEIKGKNRCYFLLNREKVNKMMECVMGGENEH